MARSWPADRWQWNSSNGQYRAKRLAPGCVDQSGGGRRHDHLGTLISGLQWASITGTIMHQGRQRLGDSSPASQVNNPLDQRRGGVEIGHYGVTLGGNAGVDGTTLSPVTTRVITSCDDDGHGVHHGRRDERLHSAGPTTRGCWANLIWSLGRSVVSLAGRARRSTNTTPRPDRTANFAGSGTSFSAGIPRRGGAGPGRQPGLTLIRSRRACSATPTRSAATPSSTVMGPQPYAAVTRPWTSTSRPPTWPPPAGPRLAVAHSPRRHMEPEPGPGSPGNQGRLVAGLGTAGRGGLERWTWTTGLEQRTGPGRVERRRLGQPG